MLFCSIRSTAAVVGFLFVAGTCGAGEITATLGNPVNYQQVSVNINNGAPATPFGAYGFPGFIPWTQTNGSNYSGISTNFYSFCIEIDQDVYIGSTYTFTTLPLTSGPIPGSPQTDNIPSIPGMGPGKADAIARLWNGYYNNLSPTNTSIASLDQAAAFQLAIWRIEYDWNPSLYSTTADFAAFLVNFNENSQGTGAQGNFLTEGDNQNGAVIALAQNLLSDVIAGQGAFGIDANLIAMTDPSAQDQVTLLAGGQGSSNAQPPTAPEPTSWCLALIGGLALGAFGYRRRQESLLAPNF